MQSINFNSRITKEIKSKTEEIHNLEDGITKALPEEYKSKLLYNIETSNKKDVQSRLA